MASIDERLTTLENALLLTTKYDTGWVQQAAWANVELMVYHNLGASLRELIVMVYLSPDGTDAPAVEVGTFHLVYSSGTYYRGYSLYNVDNAAFKIQTGGHGVTYVDEVGAQAVAANNSYYRIVVYRPSCVSYITDNTLSSRLALVENDAALLVAPVDTEKFVVGTHFYRIKAEHRTTTPDISLNPSYTVWSLVDFSALLTALGADVSKVKGIRVIVSVGDFTDQYASLVARPYGSTVGADYATKFFTINYYGRMQSDLEIRDGKFELAEAGSANEASLIELNIEGFWL